MTITVPKFQDFNEFLLWYAQFQAERDARDAQREAERDARDTAREAERQAREAQHEAERQARTAERQAREAQHEAERQAREAQHEAERQARTAERQAREARHEAERQARTAERQAREAEHQAREAELKAHIAKLQADTAELERQRKEYQLDWEKRQKAAEIRFARTEKQIGDLGNTLGYFTQSLVEPEICNHFQRRGFNVSSSYTNRKVKVNGEFIAEIDLTVENGDTTVLVEVKTTLKEAHVDEHIARLTAVQQANVPPYAGKKLVGAIAAINVPESVERYAIKAGFFVLYPVEEIVGVVNSDDFQPRVWEPIA